MSNYKIETKCIQSGYEPNMESRVYFRFIRVQHLNTIAAIRDGSSVRMEESGYFYTRLQNPTNDAVAAKNLRFGRRSCSNADIFWSGSELLCHYEYL